MILVRAMSHHPLRVDRGTRATIARPCSPARRSASGSLNNASARADSVARCNAVHRAVSETWVMKCPVSDIRMMLANPRPRPTVRPLVETGPGRVEESGGRSGRQVFQSVDAPRSDGTAVVSPIGGDGANHRAGRSELDRRVRQDVRQHLCQRRRPVLPRRICSAEDGAEDPVGAGLPGLLPFEHRHLVPRSVRHGPELSRHTSNR